MIFLEVDLWPVFSLLTLPDFENMENIVPFYSLLGIQSFLIVFLTFLFKGPTDSPTPLTSQLSIEPQSLSNNHGDSFRCKLTNLILITIQIYLSCKSMQHCSYPNRSIENFENSFESQINTILSILFESSSIMKVVIGEIPLSSFIYEDILVRRHFCSILLDLFVFSRFGQLCTALGFIFRILNY